MAISFISAASTSTPVQTSVTMPTHATDDLLLMLAFTRGSNTPPTPPAGWTTITSGASASNFGGWVLARKIAASSSETSGTWSGAADLMVGVYRGINTTTPIQSYTSSNSGGSSSAVAYSSIGGGLPTGWVVACGFLSDVGNALHTPTGLTLRTSTAGNSPGGGTLSEKRMADSNGPLSSAWGGYTDSATTDKWSTISVELKAAPAVYTLSAASASIAVTGTAVAVKRGLRLSAASAAVAITTTAANVKYGRRLPAASASFTVTGLNANFPTPPRVSLVGTAAVMGATVGAMPAHLIDDLIFGFAWRNNSTTPPTLPSGFTVLSTGSVGSTSSATIGWKLATSTSETGGTWTNATALSIFVYRGFKKSSPIGATGVNAGTSTTLDYHSLTLQNPSGKSWVAMFGAHHNNDQTGMANPPSGGVNRSSVNGAGGELVGHDTRGGVTSWAGGTVSVGGTSGDWATYVAEILFGYDALLATSAAITITPSTATVRVDRRVAAASASIAVSGTAATVKAGRKLAANTVAISVSGTSAAVNHGLRLPAASASIAVTATAATFRLERKLPGVSGSVIVTGSALAFGLSFTFVASSTSIAVTTAAAALRADRKLTAASAVVSAIGSAAVLHLAHKILADSASIAVAGSTASLLATRTLSVDSALITITPQSALVYKTLLLPADAGTVTITGGDAVLRKSKLLPTDSAAITIAATDADIRVDRLLAAASAAVGIAATSMTLRRGRGLAADVGIVSIAGDVAQLFVGRKLNAAASVVSLQGSIVILSRGRRIAADCDTISVSPTLARLLIGRRMIADPGELTIEGGEAFMTVGLLPGNVVFKWFDGGHYITAQLKIKTEDGWTPVSINTT